MNLKPQDFLVALKLVALGAQHWTYARLAHELRLSASQVHAAVQRGLAAGLLTDAAYARAHSAQAPLHAPAIRTNLDSSAIVNRRNLAEFALYGAKYAFAPERLPITRGVPTSHAAPAFAGVFAEGHEPLVWPDAHGSMRGEGLRPLHPCVPGAALRDPALYELLALFDALRTGRARERGMASTRLQKLIDQAQLTGAAARPKSARRT
ncbi:hypothetical protein [Rhizobacter sp. P5_C2]